VGARKHEWRGKTALVTGASRGLGEALARELGRSGAHVTVTARDAAAIGAVVEAIRREGGAADAAVIDVGDTDAAVATIRSIDARAGGLDLVIANAGVGPTPDATSYAWETVRDACHVNFCGAIATLTASLPDMVRRGRGHVAGIGSISARAALPGALAYSTPKAGLEMAIACLRLDLAGTGVAATYVELGFVRTAMVARSSTPMPMILEPDAAARAIVRGLARRPRRIVLPRPLAAVAAGLGALPEVMRERLTAAFVRRDDRD
jgi:short-subunit dehydrogenase